MLRCKHYSFGNSSHVILQLYSALPIPNRTSSNQTERRILDAFRTRLGGAVGKGEIVAWTNSMQYMNNVLVAGDIAEDAGVAIEYTIPQTAKRIDFILTARARR